LNFGMQTCTLKTSSKKTRITIQSHSKGDKNFLHIHSFPQLIQSVAFAHSRKYRLVPQRRT